jgi:trans-aconitate 2-methyltransferase
MTDANRNTHWNAEVYDRIGTPMRRWAQAVIDDLHLRGDETVLDAGCGSGSVTFDLLERLPQGRIYAVDSSPEMISKMGQAIEERGEKRITPILGSLTDFELPEPVDVVFSNAVLHWIPDDEALFGCLYLATKPDGRFRAQCGGAGNITRLMEATESVEQREPYASYLGQVEFRKYRTEEEAQAAMEHAGWSDVRASLFESPVRFDNYDEASLYLRTIILQRHVAALPEEHQEQFLRAVIDETIRRFGEPFTADYVRLDLWARRAE